MTPLTLLAAQKLQSKLTSSNALEQQIELIAEALNVSIPPIPVQQVLLSSAPADLGDRNLDFSYPRVCIYSAGIKNSQFEKFRSFSGQVALVAEIWASADLVGQADQWIHFYVEGVSSILRMNIGDWGDGMFFAGAYEVQFQAPKAGGLGFVESAKLTMSLNASLS